MLPSQSSPLGSQGSSDTCAIAFLERLVYNILYLPSHAYLPLCLFGGPKLTLLGLESCTAGRGCQWISSLLFKTFLCALAFEARPLIRWPCGGPLAPGSEPKRVLS